MQLKCPAHDNLTNRQKGEGRIVIVGGKDGQIASWSTDEDGGVAGVFGKGNDQSRVVIGVNEYGNGAVSTWDKNGYCLATLK